jgi:quinol-cytochrome oxidoreductase complex cytochrome b subunit
MRANILNCSGSFYYETKGQQTAIRALQNILSTHLLNYPTPISLSYFWNFGSLAGLILIIQILTGLFLVMHYTTSIDGAFISVEHIMRDVNYGWLLRYSHANGASMFFIILYLHIARNLFYESYKYELRFVWWSGVLLLVLVMATAFLGYVLPWGQMSYWGAIVITNLFSAIPLIGQSLVIWLWGGFTVGNGTLTRFFAFHFVLPFVIIAVTLLHIYFLHKQGSSNPFILLQNFSQDVIPFYPYFFLKDLSGYILFFFFFINIIGFMPNYLGHSDNYIPANPLITPLHIVPEWYFLPFYAILRAIPDKLLGVLTMFSSILILVKIPFVHIYLSPVAIYNIYVADNLLACIFFSNFILLGWVGSQAVEDPLTAFSLYLTTIYFIVLYLASFCLFSRKFI